MTTYTKAEQATRVLKDLGLVGANETPTAEDLEWAKETLSSVVALLAAKQINIWNGSDESVPLEYLIPLSYRVGLQVAPSFGLMSQAEAMVAIDKADKDLRILAMKQVSGEPTKAEYF